jgi:alpha-L-arabinofuranosidase
VPGSVELNRWYDIRVELSGRRIRCFLDGKLIHGVTASEPQRLFASAGRDAATGDIILKVINTSTDALSATLDLDGNSKITSGAQCTVLTSSDFAHNNSMEHSRAVVPAATQIAVAETNFTRTFPARSLTVLRFTAKQP